MGREEIAEGREMMWVNKEGRKKWRWVENREINKLVVYNALKKRIKRRKEKKTKKGMKRIME